MTQYYMVPTPNLRAVNSLSPALNYLSLLKSIQAFSSTPGVGLGTFCFALAE